MIDVSLLPALHDVLTVARFGSVARASAALAVDHEPDPESEQMDDLALVRTEQLGDCCGHRRTPFD